LKGEVTNPNLRVKHLRRGEFESIILKVEACEGCCREEAEALGDGAETLKVSFVNLCIANVEYNGHFFYILMQFLFRLIGVVLWERLVVWN